MGYLTAATKESMLRHMLHDGLGESDTAGGDTAGAYVLASLGGQMHATNGALNVPAVGSQGYGGDVLSGFFADDFIGAGAWSFATTGTGADAVVTATNASEINFGTATARVTCSALVLSNHTSQGTPEDGVCMAVIDVVDSSGEATSRTFEIGDQVRFPVGSLRISL